MKKSELIEKIKTIKDNPALNEWETAFIADHADRAEQYGNKTKFSDSQVERVKEIIYRVLAPATECPKCKKPMKRINKKGSRTEFFWGCTGYPTCKQTASDEEGKPVFESETDDEEV